MRLLRAMCARHELIPKSLKFDLCDDSSGELMYRGGFGDVWYHKLQEQEIAVKVLKVYRSRDLQQITRVGYSTSLPAELLKR